MRWGASGLQRGGRSLQNEKTRCSVIGSLTRHIRSSKKVISDNCYYEQRPTFKFLKEEVKVDCLQVKMIYRPKGHMGVGEGCSEPLHVLVGEKPETERLPMKPVPRACSTVTTR